MRKIIGILLFSSLSTSLLAQKKDYKAAVISFYNLENLYDTVDNTMTNDEEFLPNGVRNYDSSIYFDKLCKLATVISQIGVEINPDGPAILGVAEVENDTVLNDLIKQPLIAKRNYKIVHYDSRDRGVDAGLLYNPKYLGVEASDKLLVQLPGGSKDAYFTRDILWVKGKLGGETIHIYVNHWPSRSGGEQRSAFRQGMRQHRYAKITNVDTLTLTATPIPRTLQFSLMAARDLSIIRTPPPNRQPIHTERRSFSDDFIREALYFEVDRGGQVFFVHNRVKNLTDVATMLRTMCPDIRIQVAHGQMEPGPLEQTLMDFIHKKIDVLVSTNIIETGLDIPKANTIIINNTHQFGLSDLHQLRGRVGRSTY